MHRRRVVGDRITYVGLDVHKGEIVVAVGDAIDLAAVMISDKFARKTAEKQGCPRDKYLT
jgi:hypothetical protein